MANHIVIPVRVRVCDDAAVVGVADLAAVVDVPPQLLLQRVHLRPLGFATMISIIVETKNAWLKKANEELGKQLLPIMKTFNSLN